ncbi:MAG: restriction endonuclease [Candidatus Thorarchaeota archaeon]
MAIPDYATIMLPLLKYTADQEEHHIREVIDYLTKIFKLSEDEKRELLPSGGDTLFSNRCQWARTHLVKAGLLESTRRGYIKISQRGLEALNKNPEKINNEFLMQYPEFVEFLKPSDKKTKRIEEQTDERETPVESIEYGYQQLKQQLAQELLAQVKNTTPSFFEKLVVELLVKMGYGGSIRDAGSILGKSGDEGIDGTIKEDQLGLDIIYIQAKKWDNTTIGRPELQKFVGALKGQQANKGVFITTSKFSDGARDYVAKIDSKVVLIDGEYLAELMVDYDVGVSRVATYEIKRIDSDYFIEE